MNTAHESVIATAVGDGAAAGTFAAIAGTSLKVRDAKAARLYAMTSYSNIAATSSYQLKSSLLHDAQIGMGLSAFAAPTVVAYEGSQRLVPQDDLVMDGAGATGSGDSDLFILDVEYDDLGGVDGVFLGPKDLSKRIEDFYTFDVDLAMGDAVFGAKAAINSLQDQFKANRDYASLGVSHQQSVSIGGFVRFTGVDWGNLGLVVPPGFAGGVYDNAAHFVALSRITGIDCVPVFNASNKGTLMLDALNMGTSTATVTFRINTAILKRGR